jgi:DNA-binding transcriptional LysR family regulator
MGEFLPAVLQKFLRRHPDIHVDLRERLSHEIVRAVGEGKVEVGIVSGYERTEALQVLPYREDRLVLVVPAGHALAREPAVAFADTLAFDHVGLQEGSALRTFLQRQSDDLPRALRLRIEVSNFETACRMVEAGVGIGVMPASAARRHARAPALELVALGDAWAVRRMQLCMRSLESLPAFARDLVDLLLEDAAHAGGAGA